MKRTLRVCAIMFCALLWLNPAGAQRQLKPMPTNDGTELKMDKIKPAAQRIADARPMAVANVELINGALPVNVQKNAKSIQPARDIYIAGS